MDHGLASAPLVHGPVDSVPRVFFRKIIHSVIDFSWHFALKPWLCCKSTRSPKPYVILSVRSLVSENYSQICPKPSKISFKPLKISQILHMSLSFIPRPSRHSVNFKYTPRTSWNDHFAPRTSFIHIFSTVTLNQVILAPQFSESYPLSLQSIPMIIIIAFMWLYAWALRESFWSRRTKTFKSKSTRISSWSIRGLRSFLFKAMMQVSLNILHLYIFYLLCSCSIACLCLWMHTYDRIDYNCLILSWSLSIVLG
jgi:hypothetical protein